MENLSSGDESCAARVPEVRLVERFARQARELTPAQGSAANRASEEQLRVVSAALLTCEDLIVRAAENGAGDGVGLRGGTFSVAKARAGYRLTLREVRWTEDVAVSGEIDSPGRTGVVRAVLELSAPQGERGKLEVQWPEGVARARARVRGSLGGHASWSRRRPRPERVQLGARAA